MKTIGHVCVIARQSGTSPDVAPTTGSSPSESTQGLRTALVGRFQQEYDLKEGDLPAQLLVDEVKLAKIRSNDGIDWDVYIFAKLPLLIDHLDTLIPTLPTLWLLPDLLPTFTVGQHLQQRLCSGVDLMLPGVLRFTMPSNSPSLQSISPDTICAINSDQNKAPFALGFAQLDLDANVVDGDSFKRMKGKAVKIFHALGDHLCALADNPIMPTIAWTVDDADDDVDDNSNHPIDDDNDLVVDADLEPVKDSGDQQKEIDELMETLFLKALVSLPKTIGLPLLVSTFYSQYMLGQKSPEVKLDVKKSSYKKLNVFLKEMTRRDLIKMDEPKPGIAVISAVNWDHDDLQTVNSTKPVSANPTVKSTSSQPSGYPGPVKVEEVRAISGSGPLISFYLKMQLKTGDLISQREAHEAVERYVKDNNLTCRDKTGFVYLDQLLRSCCDPMMFEEAPKSTLANPIHIISYKNLYSCMLKGLPTVYRLTSPDPSKPVNVWRKKGPPRIHLYSISKFGKHMTRIANLTIFGIDSDAFTKHLQRMLACSVCRVSDQQYPDVEVIQAQGNHLIALSKLLTETYSIPAKHINGYTVAKQKKNKQK